MKKLIIEGGHILSGKVEIGGDKNSAVALIPAAILSDEIVTLTNIPNISDIEVLKDLLEDLGCKVELKNSTITIDASNLKNKKISEESSKKLRASYYLMGSLIGRFKSVEMDFPGGCKIGSRPIDQHLKGFEALGAKIDKEDKTYKIKADDLTGAKIRIDMPGKGASTSVGATVNIILAAVKAKGVTIIENAALEPQIVSLATFLNNMGAKIYGAGTNIITIEGVDYLGSATYEVIPDRMEAGTYIIIGSLIGENLEITKMIPEHLEALLYKLKEAGISIERKDESIIVSRSESLNPIDIKTDVYPGFVTDLQQPMTVLLTQCNGTSTIEETIYESRFNNIPYLNKMGANIEIIDKTPYRMKAKIDGKTNFHGNLVEMTDLRAGACLVIAALIAKGKTTITNIDHILRGYDKLIEKLTKLGAKIKIE